MKYTNLDNIYCASIGLPVNIQHEESYEEFYFDGDFDSLISEIRSEEALIDYAETFASISAFNAEEKIKMCKKLKFVTRGNTKKYESMENYLDNMIYSLEEDQENNPEAEKKEESSNGENKSHLKDDLKNIWDSKEKWYKKIWESIKTIFFKIVEFIRSKINQFITWWREKSLNKLDSELNELSENENGDVVYILERFEFPTEKLSFVNSNDGIIPINFEAVKTLNNKFEIIKNLCKNFDGLIGYFENGNQLDGMFPWINRLGEAFGTFLGANLPKLNSNDKKALSEYKQKMAEFKKSVTYDSDPKKFAKAFTGQDLLPKDSDFITIISGISSNSGKGSERLKETRQNLEKIIDYLKNFNKNIGESENLIKTADRKFNNVLNNLRKADKEKNEAETYMQMFDIVTTAFNVLSKILNIGSTISKKMIETCNSIISSEFNILKIWKTGRKENKQEKADAKAAAEKNQQQKTADKQKEEKRQNEDSENIEISNRKKVIEEWLNNNENIGRIHTRINGMDISDNAKKQLHAFANDIDDEYKKIEETKNNNRIARQIQESAKYGADYSGDSWWYTF